MFTVYLIKVAWSGDARICACVNKILLGCQILEKLFYENLKKKSFSFVKFNFSLIFRDVLLVEWNYALKYCT